MSDAAIFLAAPRKDRMVPPKLPLSELEALLAERSPAVAEAVLRIARNLRPCVRLETSRANRVPIKGRGINRFLCRPRPTPVLPTIASKFGGRPYCEHPSKLADGAFLGQINFAGLWGKVGRQGRRRHRPGDGPSPWR